MTTQAGKDASHNLTTLTEKSIKKSTDSRRAKLFFHADAIEKFLLGDDLDPKLSCLIQLAPCGFTGDDERCLLAHAARCFSAEPHHEFFEFLAVKLLHRAGDDDSLPRQRF